jgi:ABC-type transport system involved in cytochrome c biogenesis permease subunit
MKRFVPLLVLLLGIAMLAKTLRPLGHESAFDLEGFSRLPVLMNGRLKPMDTVARSSLLKLQARQLVLLPDGTKLSPQEWLLDVFFRSERADTYPTFVIDNLELLSLLGRKPDSLKITHTGLVKQALAIAGFIPSTQRRFPFAELQPHLAEIDRQATIAAKVEAPVRTPFQRAAVDLRDKIFLYQRLKHALVPADGTDFLTELMNFQKIVPAGVAAIRAKQANEPHDAEVANAMIELGQRYVFMADATNLLVVPPNEQETDPNAWKNSGQALLETFRTGEVDVAALTYAGFARAWRQNQPEQFNGLVTRYRAALERRFGPQLAKCAVEARFNSAEPFYTSLKLYVFAFFLAIASWLKWPEMLGRSAFYLVLLGWIIATAGIGMRMWIEGRPPVTNLYSSALFVGWGAVGLCLVLEQIYKNAIGCVAATMIGFATLMIAHHLSLSGDTMEMMRAVLDSNFWLATHVVVVVSGYSATFLAGFLALIYILMGLFTPWLGRTPTGKEVAMIAAASPLGGVAAAVTKSSGETNAKMLERMVYGIVCFATLFSFVGTVLGGIWADQSWGRFWGWDPKENGALIIVIWNALILHARWGGLIKQRGLMCLAIGGNIATAWSWFGTNMLGVGLHSYGFTDAAFVALISFALSQLVLIGLANVPLEKWRSFRSA